jgi:hypothetical protein
MRALYHSQTKKLHGVPMCRISSYPQLVPLRVVKGCARTDRCVCVSVEAKNSCVSMYSLTTTKVRRALCCGEEHATKSTKAVRTTCCVWCALYANCDPVDVTRWRPRLPFLPLWFPNLAAEVVQCVSIVSCSKDHATETPPADTFRP